VKLEKTVLAWWLTKVREYLGTSDPDVVRLMGRQGPDEIATAIVDGTKLTDVAQRTSLLAGGAAAIDAYHDPLIDFARMLDGPARSVRADYEDNVASTITKNSGVIAKARFALEGKATYPDATFTLRLSYGRVDGYTENGHRVAPTTNFAGAYAHATGRYPFELPQSWLAAEQSNGEVIGLIFDGNIQSLGGDFGYDGTVNRAVAVDVVGIVEALRHIYHADRLAQELTR
jgi:hypothetical protein